MKRRELLKWSAPVVVVVVLPVHAQTTEFCLAPETYCQIGSPPDESMSGIPLSIEATE